MGSITLKYMQEFLSGISDYNLRMSNRAYVEIKEPLYQIAPLRFKSAQLGVLEGYILWFLTPIHFLYQLSLRFQIAPDNILSEKK